MATTYTFSPVTATDRAGVVWVAAILSLLFSILTLATRFHIKARTLGPDDWLIAAASFVGIGQYIAIYVGLSQGVGKSSSLLTESYSDRLGKAVVASEVLFLLALMTSKLSVIYFMKRLFTREHGKAWWMCTAATVATITWGLSGALAVSVKCDGHQALYGSERCSGKLLRWEIVIAFDGLLEITFVSIAAILVAPLQMKLWIKATIVFAFAFRLMCALFASLHGVWIGKYVRADDPGLAIADVLVWQQVALGYALIAATIPTLKNFVRGYNKAMGWKSSSEKRGLGGGYNLGSIVRSGRHTLQQQSKHMRSNSEGADSCKGKSHASRSRHDMELGKTNIHTGVSGSEYRVGAFHDTGKGKTARKQINGYDSDEDPIIRRDVSVTIEVEHGMLSPRSRTNSNPSDS